MDYTINRFFSVYGPRMDNTGAYTEVIFNWLNRIKQMKSGEIKDKSIKVFGNPDEKILDLVYVDDVVDAIMTMTFASNKETFNVATQKGTSLLDLFNIVKKVSGAPLVLEVIPLTRTDIENKRVGCIDKLRKLGWEPRVDVQEGIRRSYEWLRSV